MSWAPISDPADGWSKAGQASTPGWSIPADGAINFDRVKAPDAFWIKEFGVIDITFWDLNETAWDADQNGQATTLWDLGFKTEGWERQ